MKYLFEFTEQILEPKYVYNEIRFESLLCLNIAFYVKMNDTAEIKLKANSSITEFMRFNIQPIYSKYLRMTELNSFYYVT